MVLVLDMLKHPLMPCSEKRARQLLERGRAVVHQMGPFTIRVKGRVPAGSVFQPLWVKFDPGRTTTGVAIVLEGPQGPKVIFFGEIVHKAGIKARLDDRRAHRQSRRQRKTRFQNRARKEGWLPPFLEAQGNQRLHVLAKIRRLVPITDLRVEHVRFDTQKLENPEISGVEYQQDTLLGDEVREYLLEKWGRTCVYCGVTDVPLEVEHIVPKSRGATDWVSNLALAYHPCHQTKGSQTAAEFRDPGLQAQTKKPVKDAAMMNATRWRLSEQRQTTGRGSGGRTKKQRLDHGFPKEHCSAALCVVRAVGPRGTYAGTHRGSVLVRAGGTFDISAPGKRLVQGIAYKHCRILQRNGGWMYEPKPVSA